MIKYQDSNKYFFIETKNTSYIFSVVNNDILKHIYYGKKINRDNLDYYNTFCERAFSPVIKVNGNISSLDTLPQEFPTSGRGDYRQPAIDLTDSDGRNICELKYEDYRISDGAPILSGLPHLSSKNAQTLEIKLADSFLGIDVYLFYTAFYDDDIITRHTVVKNNSVKSIKIDKLASCNIDLICRNDLELIELQGAWARERGVERVKLHHGITSIDSCRGASGHQLNPFLALVTPDTNEDSGEVYAASLVYSGNFSMSVEKDQFNGLRLQAGINPYHFSWNLNPGECFTAPQVVLTYSSNGLTEMSHNFHSVCRKYLGQSAKPEKNRQIVLNNWEATYFNFNEEKLLNLIQKCKGMGIDTFVLDDGWFGCRNSDNCSLGDWYIDTKKLPNGLTPLVNACEENDMNFGLWFEPEMISENSDLYRKHPDWCIHTDGRNPVESRNQLVLDLSRKEIVDAVYEMISKILSQNNIRYVKWDMNRNITDNGSSSLKPCQQGQHAHRYILGVYDLMQRLTTNFPHILFEGCAGGGGRFDFGILYYMPQFWTSDDSDAAERLNIQYGTSYVYPPSAMTAHVSACPNHQTGRTTPFETRSNIAMLCNFGYELDITKLSDNELESMKKQTELHHRLESLVESGDFYRLISPFENNTCAWETVSKDKKFAFAVFARKMSVPNDPGYVLKFKGLDANTVYNIKELGIQLSGNTLMNAGIPILPSMTEYWSCTFELSAI